MLLRHRFWLSSSDFVRKKNAAVGGQNEDTASSRGEPLHCGRSQRHSTP
jgi:hypothetical protein